MSSQVSNIASRIDSTLLRKRREVFALLNYEFSNFQNELETETSSFPGKELADHPAGKKLREELRNFNNIQSISKSFELLDNNESGAFFQDNMFSLTETTEKFKSRMFGALNNWVNFSLLEIGWDILKFDKSILQKKQLISSVYQALSSKKEIPSLEYFAEIIGVSEVLNEHDDALSISYILTFDCIVTLTNTVPKDFFPYVAIIAANESLNPTDIKNNFKNLNFEEKQRIISENRQFLPMVQRYETFEAITQKTKKTKTTISKVNYTINPEIGRSSRINEILNLDYFQNFMKGE